MARVQIKARYWTAVCYPENMIPDWEDKIGDILCHAYCYCIHDKDNLAVYKGADNEEQERQRKTHVHIILCFPNTTTYNNALRVFQKLSKDDAQCCNKVEPVDGIRNMYEYLIHNTETCKKQGKYLYANTARKSGNNFDIGAFEQLSCDEKEKIIDELEILVMEHNIMNYCDLMKILISEYEPTYKKVLRGVSSHIKSIIKGNYQRFVFERDNGTSTQSKEKGD